MEPIIIGTVGAAIILIAFLLNQFRLLSESSVWYDILNLVGSLLLIIYAIMLSSWPFLLLNGVWAIVSGKDVIIYLFKRK